MKSENAGQTLRTRDQRNMSIELLRIISMLMIVTLHYLLFGNALSKTSIFSPNYIISWTLEAFSVIAVNCYVLISGYFLVTSKFKIKKVLIIWGQVIFYSVAIYAVLMATGIIQFDYKVLIKSLLPVLTSQYWFATTYIGLYLLFPFLNILIRSMTKRQMQIMLLTLFAVFSLWKTVIPFAVTLDSTNGYGILWFVTLYFFAAYIRLYWNYNINKYWYLAGYIVISLLVAASKLVLTKISLSLGFGGAFSTIFYQYDSCSIFLSSIMLFMYFKNINLKNARIGRVIGKGAGLTFGVYLIHENSSLRSILYAKILHTDLFWNSQFFLPAAFASIIAVFVTSALIEAIRQKAFSYFENGKFVNNLCAKLERLPAFISDKLKSNVEHFSADKGKMPPEK